MEDLLEILRDLHPEVDSFDIVSIIAEVNDQFEVTISAEHIIPENFNSARALYELIQRLEDED